MKSSIKSILATVAVATGLLTMNTAIAGPIPYPNSGSENLATYNFTAVSTGDILGYFAGSTAGYTQVVGMSKNGGSVLSWGLNNHASALGASFNFGSVSSGDTLRFFIYVYDTGYTYSSDKSLNSDGVNHIYSTSAAANQVYSGSPVGVYVAFEDLHGGGDFNYHDNTFVFTNVSNGVDNVPDGASTVVALGGALMGLAAFRRRIA